MADPQFTQSLFATLEQTIAPDTQVIKAATVQLNNHFYTDARCVPSLFEIGTSSPNVAIRQLALVELRKRVSAKKNKQWLSQSQDLRSAFKTRLLEFLLTETNNQARAASTRLVSAIAKFELEKGVWPELLPWLWQMSAAPTAAHREVALQTIFMLLDSIAIAPNQPGGNAVNQIPAIIELLSKTLQDPESLNVRVWSIRALGKLAEFLEAGEEKEIAAFQGLIPGVVAALQQALDAGDESSAKSIFEFFEGIVLSEVPLVTPHLPALIQFLLGAAGNQSYDSDLRIMALNALLWLVKFKKGKVQSLNLAGSIITALLPIGAEPEPVDIEDDAPSRTAFRVIDVLATSLPPAQVFPPLFEQVRTLAASPDAGLRKSAITAFGVGVEGCSLYIQPHLEQMWPLISNGLQDPEAIVRKAACTALGCLCEMLEEECAKQHAMLLPLISKLMGDPVTQRQACIALDCLLEVLGADIEPYIPSLMDALVQLLDNAPLSLKGTVVGAIGSAAHASKTKFAPYFDAVMQRLVQFLQLTEEGEELDLRGVAQDTVGTLAEAVGPEQFRPYYAPLMQQAIAAIGIENAPNLKECSYIFWAVLSRVYKEEFASYFPVIMPIILAAIGQEEIDEAALLGDNATTDFATGVDADDDDPDFEDIDEDIDSDDEDAFFKASTQIAIEKECAADALCEVFDNTGKQFLPYVEASVKALLPGLEHHWHDGIRKSSVSALLGFIATLNRITEPPKWSKGVAGNQLNSDVAQLVQAVLPPVLDCWEEEDEREVVNELCNSISAALMSVGPALIAPTYVEQICTRISEILRRKAKCQISDEDDAEVVAAGDQSEYDAALIGAAADLVGSLATTLGSDFAQLFPAFLPDMVAYYDRERSMSDRSTAIGSLAEITNGMEAAVTPFTESLFPLFLTALSDPEPEVQSNAAFAMGALVFHTQADLSSQYLTVLGALHPLFGLPDDGASKHENAKDNACGAVARMLVKNLGAVPADQVLPVFFQSLPLRRDYAESEPVFNAVVSLLQQQHPLALANLDHILSVFAKALASTKTPTGDEFYPNGDSQLTQDNAGRLVEVVKALAASQPEKVQAAGLAPFLQ